MAFDVESIGQWNINKSMEPLIILSFIWKNNYAITVS